MAEITDPAERARVWDQIRADHRARREADSREFFAIHRSMVGGVDAAAFAAVLTIAQREAASPLLAAACVLFCIAIPFLTASLLFGAHLPETFQESMTSMDARIDGVALILCIGGLTLVAWNIWWVCGTVFLIGAAIAIPLTVYRLNREFLRRASETDEPQCHTTYHLPDRRTLTVLPTSRGGINGVVQQPTELASKSVQVQSAET
jgi:hypothetical protein